jgi:hypothetical protein
MTKTRSRPAAAATPPAEPATAADAVVVERPDGFYWVADGGRNEVGPFASFAAAQADMNAAFESDLEPAETLQEAEAEIGIAEWIDPETGLPAEEERPRIEDH